MCKLIIAGSRSIKDYATVRDAIIRSGLWEAHKRSIVVISGKAKGVDTLGEEFASKAGCKVLPYAANWDNIKADGAVVKTRYNGKKYNALAGHWRNEEMAEIADAALIVWDGNSTGSLDMLHRMLEKEKPVYLYALRIGTDAYDRLIDKGVNIIFPEIS
jgi:predicted Rossmann fold nucleotide-binding protein DprA/Smf involved in DNA uptake